MTLWWVFWRLRWNSWPLGGSLVSAGYLLAHWYLQQYKCTTGYLQLNGALSIKLHMCHHHHFGRLHKQTNGLGAILPPLCQPSSWILWRRWRIPWARSMPFIAFIEVSTYSHTKDISLFWISTRKWRIVITFPCPAGALRGCSALRLSC